MRETLSCADLHKLQQLPVTLFMMNFLKHSAFYRQRSCTGVTKYSKNEEKLYSNT